MRLFNFIKAEKFFSTYLPHIKNYKRKISGNNGRGNPVDFSTSEKDEINKALHQLFKELTQP